jgi:hypothetical protein
MADWKGTRVSIQIMDMDLKSVYSEKVLLDTDTMNDLFDRFNPGEHIYSIIRLRENLDK